MHQNNPASFFLFIIPAFYRAMPSCPPAAVIVSRVFALHNLHMTVSSAVTKFTSDCISYESIGCFNHIIIFFQ